MTYGAEIVRASYDYDTHMIGEFKIPLDLYYDPVSSTRTVFTECIFYKTLLSNENALAVFNVNNNCIAVIENWGGYEVGMDGNPDTTLLQWSFNEPICKKVYKKIGYIKTYQDNLAVSTVPYGLFTDESGEIVGYPGKLVGTPMENPPYSLYKALINTDDDVVGVYFDMDRMGAAFIRR